MDGVKYKSKYICGGGGELRYKGTYGWGVK